MSDEQSKTIIYTYGVFDLFHSGHLELLKEAKALGDYLIVGLFTDEVAEGFKRRPIIPLEHRIAMLKNCVFVDEVVTQDQLAPDKNILSYKPNILAKGPGAGWEEGAKTPGEDAMLSIGGRVVKLNYHEGISTSDIIKKITTANHPARSCSPGIILVSNNLLNKTNIEFPEDQIVVRVNVAWVKDKKELTELLDGIKHDIYLDYPLGRTKPPRPTLTLNEVIGLVPLYKRVKHFAVSNVEDPQVIALIKSLLPPDVNVVPKIETKKGIEALSEIIDSIAARHIMLDKEDLYLDVNRDSKLFESLIEAARKTCKNNGVEVLELQGVVFSPYE